MKKIYLKGFTLIELIVVIAIIAVLAGGLIIAIQPAQKSAEATDVTRKAANTEYFNATQRFSTNQGYFPNCTSAGVGCTEVTVAGIALSAMGAGGNFLTNLGSSTIGEMNANYWSNLPANVKTNIFLSTDVVATPTYIRFCWKPTSNKFAADAASLYTQNGTVLVGCPGLPSVGCHICLK